MPDYDYYKVTPGGEIEKIIRTFLDERVQAMKARDAVLEKYGASACYASANSIAAVAFKGVVAPGFRRSAKWKNYYEPNRQTKMGREIGRDLVIPVPGWFDFSSELPNHKLIIGGARQGGGFNVNYVMFEEFDGAFVLHVPFNSEGKPGWIPPTADTVLLKRSEYWSMKEQDKIKIASKKAA